MMMFRPDDAGDGSGSVTTVSVKSPLLGKLLGGLSPLEMSVSENGIYIDEVETMGSPGLPSGNPNGLAGWLSGMLDSILEAKGLHDAADEELFSAIYVYYDETEYDALKQVLALGHAEQALVLRHLEDLWKNRNGKPGNILEALPPDRQAAILGLLSGFSKSGLNALESDLDGIIGTRDLHEAKRIINKNSALINGSAEAYEVSIIKEAPALRRRLLEKETLANGQVSRTLTEAAFEDDDLDGYEE